MRLKGKVALVTGGTSGIGGAIAQAFAHEGSHLVLNYLNNTEEAEEFKKYLRRTYDVKVMLIEADISKEKAVKQMIGTVIRSFGKIDILVNNAGILTQAALYEMDSDTWDRMINVNLRGVFLNCKYVLPSMMEQQFGRIINIASQLGQTGGEGLAHYCAAKAGVIGFSKSLAREVGHDGITVNCIAPGPVETNLIKDLTNAWKEEKKKELVIPRFGTPDEIAPTAVLLASQPDGNLYTGQTLGPNSGDVML